MVKIVLGLVLGLLIGIGCRCFDIPLPGPPKLIEALVILAVTLGYVGADYLITTKAKVASVVALPAMSENYGGPIRLPPSRERPLTK